MRQRRCRCRQQFRIVTFPLFHNPTIPLGLTPSNPKTTATTAHPPHHLTGGSGVPPLHQKPKTFHLIRISRMGNAGRNGGECYTPVFPLRSMSLMSRLMRLRIFLSSSCHPVYSYHARGVKLTFMVARPLFRLQSIRAFSLRRAQTILSTRGGRAGLPRTRKVRGFSSQPQYA